MSVVDAPADCVALDDLDAHGSGVSESLLVSAYAVQAENVGVGQMTPDGLLIGFV